jgi:tRNA threonylcarbamoyladenosine biosynthesis protein TsaB
MLLISIDTSGRNGSVALCRGDENSFTALQVMTVEGGSYSARLMPVIAELLANQELSKEQIDAFVVVSGPGSFTGLRVGLATVKGLCEVLQKPLVAVSMLEAVAVAETRLSSTASAAEGQPNIAVALDAGRGEIYVGEFTIADARALVVREYISKLDAFAAEVALSKLVVLSPDAKIVEALIASGVAAQQVAAVHAEEIGRLGLAILLAGDIADVATLDANYIRRSDAEMFSTPKR